MRFRVVLPLLVTGTALLSGIGCSASDITNSVTPPDSTNIVTQIAVAPTTRSLAVAQTAQLTATATNNAGATIASATVTWTSSAANVATVSTAGLVTAVAVGATTITAASNGKSATSAITVTAADTTSVHEIAVAAIAGVNEQSNSGATDGTNLFIALQGHTSDGKSQVGWVVTSATGTVTAGPTYLSGVMGDPPRVAFGGGKYLETWNDFSASVSRIMGQFITTAGVASGSPFVIANGAAGYEDGGGVAYGGGTFLVNYRGPAGSQDAAFARTVSSAGVVGTERTLESTTNVHVGPSNIAFDGTNFLVAWADVSQVHGQFVSPAGVLGTATTVASTTFGDFSDLVGVGFNGTNYMVVFNEASNIGGSAPLEGAFAQMMSASGVLVGSKITIASAPNVGSIVVSAFGSGTNFVAGYLDSIATPTATLPFKSKVRFVSNTGTLVGNPVTIATVLNTNRYPIGFLFGGTGSDYFGVVNRGTPPTSGAPGDFDTFTAFDVYLLTAHIPLP